MILVRTALACLALAFLCAAPAAADRPADAVDGRYIVVYEDAVKDPGAETRRHQSARGFKAQLRYERAVKGFAAALSGRQVAALERDPDVAYVTQDRRMHATASVPRAAGEPVPPTGIRRIGAATNTTVREASDAGVAVLDTGVDLDHPDLNVESGINCVSSGGSEPAPQAVDPPLADDDQGHGTHVAGTIAARNNGAGVVGVAPGTQLYAVKVLGDSGSGRWSEVLCGIDWVAEKADELDIRVANMSLSGGGVNDSRCGAVSGEVIHEAICNLTAAGVVVVAAAGNDKRDFGATPDVPAAYPEVLAVTAITDTDGLPGATGGSPSCRAGSSDDTPATGFTNFATRAAEGRHTIAAPGACIVSTRRGGGHGSMSGTSMASPHVAGAVALCLSEGGVPGPCAGMTPAQTIQHLRRKAAGAVLSAPLFGFAGDPTRPIGYGKYYGYLTTADLAGATSETVDAPPAAPPPPPPPPADPAPAATPPADPAPAPEQGVLGDRLETVTTPIPGVVAAMSLRRPRLGTALRRGLRLSVSCAQACAARAEALVDARTARRLGLKAGSRPVRIAKGAASRPATAPTVTITFSRAARTRLAGTRAVKLAIRTRVAVPGAPARYLTRTVTLRR